MKTPNEKAMPTNATAQSTPGPWKDTGHDGKLCPVIESKFGSIAAVWPSCGVGAQLANARLIAAAPDLLSLLVRVCNFERRLTCSADGGPQLVADIRAAIAKATAS